MSKKKIVPMLLASVMSVGLLAGCTDSKKEPSPSAGSSASPSQSSSDYSKGFTETVNLDIPVYERAFEGWNVSDNFYTRYIQKEFGDKYNIKVNFVPITRNAEVRDFQQLLAAQKAPDIIFHYDMPQALAYYGEGVMQQLNYDEIAKYAPTYWKNLSKTNEQYGTVDGKKTFVFAARPNYSNWVSIIRKDWVEKVGMKVEDLTSLEKFNEMLVKWKQAGLGVAGGALTRNNFNYSYAFRDWPIDPKYRALYSDLAVADFTTADTERWLRNLNYQYNNGLIDKEFYLRDDDNKVKAEFVAGKTGNYGFYMSSNTDVFNATLKNNPGAQFAVVPPEAGVPQGRKPQGRADYPFGLIMGINHKSSDKERAAVWMYLEWMSQPKNLFFLQNGVEGQNYTLDSEGLPVKVKDFKGESKLSQNNNKDYWALVTEIAEFSTPELTKKANLRNWSPAGHEKLAEQMIKYWEDYSQYRTPDAMFTVVLKKVSEYKADLNALFQEQYLKVALAPADKFDAVYAEAKKKFLEAGYQEILNEKQKAIDAKQFK
ncbi:extracellular solute-binding protein [Paenibacillus sedimenti]|uniref:ABC transporter substrate-binding protein n=1 Tax=Paenibacillus sedimenti TaxID=2770274 RepID=A0A926KT59_9BACL|nr:extracellular solute-binding protein [Paenibacillus sedimenti]MBD0382848.1 ABC transporter substrate-binding protein [Paenibacillus sedimenti]